MKFLLIVGVIAVFLTGFLVGHHLRKPAGLLDSFRIRDNTVLVAPLSPEADAEALHFEEVSSWYAPIPILVIDEWSGSGVIGEGQEPSSMHWECPEPYTLTFRDGTDIPVCVSSFVAMPNDSGR